MNLTESLTTDVLSILKHLHIEDIHIEDHVDTTTYTFIATPEKNPQLFYIKNKSGKIISTFADASVHGHYSVSANSYAAEYLLSYIKTGLKDKFRDTAFDFKDCIKANTTFTKKQDLVTSIKYEIKVRDLNWKSKDFIINNSDIEETLNYLYPKIMNKINENIDIVKSGLYLSEIKTKQTGKYAQPTFFSVNTDNSVRLTFRYFRSDRAKRGEEINWDDYHFYNRTKNTISKDDCESLTNLCSIICLDVLGEVEISNKEAQKFFNSINKIYVAVDPNSNQPYASGYSSVFCVSMAFHVPNNIGLENNLSILGQNTANQDFYKNSYYGYYGSGFGDGKTISLDHTDTQPLEFNTEESLKTSYDYENKLLGEKVMSGKEKLSIYLKENLNESIESKWKTYEGKIDREIFDQLVRFDPTYNTENPNLEGKYLKWLLNAYINKQITKDDFGHVRDCLSRFEENKSQLKNKDIMTFRTLGDIENYLNDEKNYIPKSKSQIAREFRRQVQKVDLTQDADCIYSGDQYEVWIPYTHTAANRIANGAQWCTSSGVSDSYFRSYTSRGKLIDIVPHNTIKLSDDPKDDRVPGSTDNKYQFHFHDGAYMDGLDRTVDIISTIRNTDIELFNVLAPYAEQEGRQELANDFRSYYKLFTNANEYFEIKKDWIVIKKSFNTLSRKVQKTVLGNYTKIEIEEGITKFPSYLISMNLKIKEVKLPSTITDLPKDAFLCSGVESLDLSHIKTAHSGALCALGLKTLL